MTRTLEPRADERRAGRGDLVRSGLRGLGQTLITLGVVMLLFVVYSLYVTNLFTARDQRQLNDQLNDAWARPPAPVAGARPPPPAALPPPGIGDAFARIYVPSIGVGMEDALAIVQGVSVADLKKGPGHIPDTQLPGTIGNTVISGHRTTYGAPFSALDKVRVGDPIILETATQFFVYRMTSSEIVRPTAYEVTLPVPGQPDVAPTVAQVTLTTCNPKYSARQRLIVHGELAETVDKAGGVRPAELQGV